MCNIEIEKQIKKIRTQNYNFEQYLKRNSKKLQNLKIFIGLKHIFMSLGGVALILFIYLVFNIIPTILNVALSLILTETYINSMIHFEYQNKCSKIQYGLNIINKELKKNRQKIDNLNKIKIKTNNQVEKKAKIIDNDRKIDVISINKVKKLTK